MILQVCALIITFFLKELNNLTLVSLQFSLRSTPTLLGKNIIPVKLVKITPMDNLLPKPFLVIMKKTHVFLTLKERDDPPPTFPPQLKKRGLQ